ncbi:DGQHR domain-containing protein DpdB [Myxococcota bacterium]
MPRRRKKISRRAICVGQNKDHPLYMFTLTANEILQLADISRVSRDSAGKLIGYQRAEVRKHVQDIITYLDSKDVIFPNSIILALLSDVKFIRSRGPKVDDGHARAGTLEIPLPGPKAQKTGWIVDGQQRALALSKSKRKDFPVPVNAFVADEINVQRDQFLRINNTKPLPRGLVTELLPEVSTPLPAKLAARRIPSALCDVLNNKKKSPFCGMIRRASTSRENKKKAVITDTSVVKMIQESITSPSGCLFPYRNIATGETDFDGIWLVLTTYWAAVRDVFPDAWGKKPARSRLMHGVGIRAMGRLMDKVMAAYNPNDKKAAKRVKADIKLISAYCNWTSGTWEELGLRWNDLQNVPKHIRVLSNYLIRAYLLESRGGV